MFAFHFFEKFIVISIFPRRLPLLLRPTLARGSLLIPDYPTHFTQSIARRVDERRAPGENIMERHWSESTELGRT
jgi:hypothetical protein